MKIFLRHALRYLLKCKFNNPCHEKVLLKNCMSSYNSRLLSTKCQNINSMNQSDIYKFISSFDTVLTDCDGVLWVGGQPIQGSPEAIMKLRKLGKRIIFVTNNGMSRNDLLSRCHELGFGGEIDDMITSSYLCANYLKQKQFTKTVYVFGGKGLKEELDNVGIRNIGEGPDLMPQEWNLETAENVINNMEDNIGCVIVGFHYDISYLKLLKAVTYLHSSDVLFIGTNSDPMAVLHFQHKACIMPATGALISAAETASGRKALILGKPNKFMYETVKNVFPNIVPERTLMVGDRADTDVIFGKNASLKTLMVGTGTNTLDEVRHWEISENDRIHQMIPHFYSNRLFDIFQHDIFIIY